MGSFKKEVGPTNVKDLPTDSPTIPDMVTSYHEVERKRKLDDSLNSTPNAKKAKMNGAKPAAKESSESSDSSEDEKVAKNQLPKQPQLRKKTVLLMKRAKKKRKLHLSQLLMVYRRSTEKKQKVQIQMIVTAMKK